MSTIWTTIQTIKIDQSFDVCHYKTWNYLNWFQISNKCPYTREFLMCLLSQFLTLGTIAHLLWPIKFPFFSIQTYIHFQHIPSAFEWLVWIKTPQLDAVSLHFHSSRSNSLEKCTGKILLKKEKQIINLMIKAIENVQSIYAYA